MALGVLFRLFIVLAWVIQLAWTLSSTTPRNSHNDHLTDRVSSPERYASAMNMTLLELEERKEAHRQALALLQEQLQTADRVQKHELICRHRLQHLHHPFVCRKCWSYLPVCVCYHQAVVQEERRILHPNLSVVVWLHHKEWGLTSNTGGLLRLALGRDNCKLFMKGLPEHDEEFQRDYLDNREKLVVVLWPENEHGKRSKGSNSGGSNEKTSALSLEDLRKELDDGREVVVVAVDGTWRNARRMVGRLPSQIPRLDIPTSVVQRLFTDDQKASLLSPIRSKGPSGQQQPNQRNDNNLVCTAEAVTMILQELGLPSSDARNILDLARTKVDLVRRYRGHEPKNIQI